MSSLGVDFSSFGGDLAQSTIQQWKDNGVTFAVVQYSNRMPQHLEALKDSGIQTEAYVYLYWGVDPWGQTPQVRTQNALLMMAGYDVKRLWLDAEDTTHPFDARQLDACVALCEGAGVATGIYTGRWVWAGAYGNPTGFEHLPLWHAEYLGEAPSPDLSKQPQDFDAFKPYGGWTKPHTWQFWNTTTFCGHSVDLNAREADVTKEEDQLRTLIIRALLRDDYHFVERDPDPATGERVVEVLSGKDSDSQLLIRLR